MEPRGQVIQYHYIDQLEERMSLWNETRSVPVSRQMVWAAYKKVRSNHGSAGVDGVSMEAFDAHKSNTCTNCGTEWLQVATFPRQSER